jgi:hypothetical protein
MDYAYEAAAIRAFWQAARRRTESGGSTAERDYWRTEARRREAEYKALRDRAKREGTVLPPLASAQPAAGTDDPS